MFLLALSTLMNSVKTKTQRSLCSSHLQMYQNDDSSSDDDSFLVHKEVFSLIKEQKVHNLVKDVVSQHARDTEKLYLSSH